MKLKKDFVLRQVADIWVAVPLGQSSIDFNGMLTLNDSGAMLWRLLEQGGNRETLTDALTAEYDVTREQAMADVDEFIAKLINAGCTEA